MGRRGAIVNYEANTIHWVKGSVVIHDADAKEPKMLMRIVGFTRDGLAKCQYVDKRHKRTIYPNAIAPLHTPARFGLNGNWANENQHQFEKIQGEWEFMRRWNQKRYRQDVMVKTSDNDREYRVMAPACMWQDGTAVILLWPRGYCRLHLVAVIPEQESVRL